MYAAAASTAGCEREGGWSEHGPHGRPVPSPNRKEGRGSLGGTRRRHDVVCVFSVLVGPRFVPVFGLPVVPDWRPVVLVQGRWRLSRGHQAHASQDGLRKVTME